MECIPPLFCRFRSVKRLLTIRVLICITRCHSISAISHPAFAHYTPPHSPLLLSEGCITAQIQRRGRTSLEAKLNRLRINFANNTKSEQSAEKDSSLPPDERIPFVIQKIGRGDTENIEEITRLCIDVFFNDQDGVTDPKLKTVAPWKAVQLAYLRGFQYGDLMSRNAFKKNLLMDVFIARRVYPVSEAPEDDNKRKRLTAIEDEREIMNFDQLLTGKNSSQSDIKYVAGEIVGYCEVSEKNFGLGGNFESNNSSKGGKPRPYLSNLSVVEYARKSGIGSTLLDACEEAVLNWNSGHTEIVLQVEEDNQSAIKWYKRRGWKFVFADPTCRRYDTSGFFLRESRITKYAMIKRLEPKQFRVNGNDDSSNDDFGFYFVKKIRDSFSNN